MTAPPAAPAEKMLANAPRAIRIGAIAFLVNNIALGTLWGSFSLLLGPIELRLHMTREVRTLGVSAVNLAMASCAPAVGVLAERGSLRLIMVIGALLSTAGYACRSPLWATRKPEHIAWR